jgi:hypothetical protein
MAVYLTRDGTGYFFRCSVKGCEIFKDPHPVREVSERIERQHMLLRHTDLLKN